MQAGQLHFISPKLKMPSLSEAEIFGLTVLLWTQTPHQRDMPLHALTDWLLPALKTGQFALAYQLEAGAPKPVAYFSWAGLDSFTESQYVHSAHQHLAVSAWSSGDRNWIIDFIAPYGHAPEFARTILRQFNQMCFRSLYHRGDEKGMRIKTFRGVQISIQQAKSWWRDRPILAYQL